MSKKQLQRTICNDEGFIFSDGTLNLQHLLAKAYDLIFEYKLQLKDAWFSKKEIIEHFVPSKEDSIVNPNESLFLQQYYGEIELKEYRHGDIAISPYTTWDDICTFFERIAPTGFYFGSTEGDGACIGWFKLE